jgi:sulfite reductase (ferredoxin)
MELQLHFIHIEDTPDLMRRLAATGITTREACGNSVRNTTACQFAGVCKGEAFDIVPYAHGLTYFLLGHPDTQDFGRKFKIAFSGCKTEPCGLVNFHDMGAIATTRVEGGQEQRGFEVYVGGGLGAVPHHAKLLDEFVRPEELLPLSQAVSRVFARLGEKENRARARIKFLVHKLGIEEFKRLVLEERQKLREDPRWTSYLDHLEVTDEKPIRPGGDLPAGAKPEGFEEWYRTNVRDQRQDGYVVATVTLPLGDMTSRQARVLSDLARKYTGDAMRLTVEQNIAFRWISKADLPAFYQALADVRLNEPGAGSISDVTSCPGTDTCKLGISSSRGLAGELRRQLRVIKGDLAPAAQDLHIKCSGCFNSCGQHHVADLGFLGVSRQVGGRRVPHFQIVVGGEWANNGGSYGLALGAVPSKNVPAVVTRLREEYVSKKQDGESFKDFIQRFGKKNVRALLDDLMKVPSYEENPSFYSDWGDPREYTIGDMGVGECAGEVVPFVEMGLAAAEREVFEAQVLLDEANVAEAARRGFSAMLTAAKALTREVNPNLGDQENEIVAEFRRHFHDTKLFHDPYAGAKFAQYFFRAHEHRDAAADHDGARQRIEEAQLFVEAAHACYQRMSQQQTAAE